MIDNRVRRGMAYLLFSPDPIFILILKYKHQTDNNLQALSGFPVDNNIHKWNKIEWHMVECKNMCVDINKLHNTDFC